MTTPATLQGCSLFSDLRSAGAEVISKKLLLCKADETIVAADMELGNFSK